MIPWLESSEEVSRYLRGSISHDLPAVAKSESFFVVLLLLVICGFLASVLILGILHLWQGRLATGSKAINALCNESASSDASARSHRTCVSESKRRL